MKAQNLLQGALLGACMAGWASLIEAFTVYGGFPYQADPLVWAGLLPSYLISGAIFGLCCALAMPLVSSAKARHDDFNLHLGIFILVAGTTLVLLLEARMSWLVVAIPTLSAHALLTLGLVVAGGLVAYILLYRLTATSFGWAFSSFFSRFATILGLAVVLILSGICWILPVRPALVATPNRASRAATGSPNVLLVVLDTTAAKHLGCYGYHRATSPQLDAFAEEGVLFENAFAAAPWTLPSHCSLFTGLQPNSHGTGWLRPRLPDGVASVEDVVRYDIHTISEELAERGYDTMAVADKSWLTYHSGLSQGFESFYDYSIPSLRDHFFVQRFWLRYREKFGLPAPEQKDKGGARVVETAIDWLDGSRDRNQERPFFLFLHLNEAHDPYQPPSDFWGHFLPEGTSLQETYDLTPRNNTEGQHEIIVGDWDISPQDMEIFKSLYDDELLYQDGLLGHFLDKLKELELMENTLIVITADHGEEFGELNHRVGHQLSLADTLLHVPLIMRFPKQLPAGKRVHSMTSLIDIYPTILDIVEHAQGAKPRATPEILSIEGVSQLPAIQKDIKVRDMIMAHYFNPTSYLTGFTQWDPTSASGGLRGEVVRTMRSIDVLRTENEKLFIFGDGQRAFIDLEKDPQELGSEQQSITPGQMGRANQFEQRLMRQLTSYETAREKLVGQLAWFRRNVKWHNENVNTKATRQSLESLGYIGETNADGTESTDSLTLPPLLEIH